MQDKGQGPGSPRNGSGEGFVGKKVIYYRGCRGNPSYEGRVETEVLHPPMDMLVRKKSDQRRRAGKRFGLDRS